MKSLTLLLGLFLSINSIAQIENLSALSIDQIMQGEEFVGYLPISVGLTTVNSSISAGSDHHHPGFLQSRHQVKGYHKTLFCRIKELTNEGDFTKDYTWKVYDKNGDLYLINFTNSEIKQITNTIARESIPNFPEMNHPLSIE